MTADASWTLERIAWAAGLVAGAPFTVVAVAVGDLRGRRWQRRLAGWGPGGLSRALSLPALVFVLAVAWLARLEDRTALLYWWVAGLTVFAAGMGVALTAAWLRAQVSPPQPDDVDDSTPADT